MKQSFSCLHKSASPKRHLNMFSHFPQLAPVSQTNRSRYLRHVEERAILSAYRQCAPNNHRDRLDRVYPGCFDCGRFLFSQNVKFLKYFSMAFTCNAHVTYTLCLKKNKTPNSCPKLPQMLTDFQNSFTGRLTGKFATNSYLNIPPHLKRVATLPCEISMFKKSQCSRSN